MKNIFSFILKKRNTQEKTINFLRSNLETTINHSYDLYSDICDKNAAFYDLNSEFIKLQNEIREKIGKSIEESLNETGHKKIIEEKDIIINELNTEILDLKRQLKQHKNLIASYKNGISKIK